MLKSKILLIIFLSFVLIGCSSGIEMTKRSLGISTVDLEEEKGRGIIRNYNVDFNNCYYAVKDALASMDASVFLEKHQRHLVVAVGFDKIMEHMDTSRVGIFLEEIAEDKIKIEIVSVNKPLQIKAADEIFKILDKKFDVESRSLIP